MLKISPACDTVAILNHNKLSVYSLNSKNLVKSFENASGKNFAYSKCGKNINFWNNLGFSNYEIKTDSLRKYIDSHVSMRNPYVLRCDNFLVAVNEDRYCIYTCNVDNPGASFNVHKDRLNLEEHFITWCYISAIDSLRDARLVFAFKRFSYELTSIAQWELNGDCNIILKNMEDIRFLTAHDSGLVAYVNSDNFLGMFHIQKGQKSIWYLSKHLSPKITSLAFDYTGGLLAVGAINGEVSVYNTDKDVYPGRIIHRQKNSVSVSSLTFSSWGSLLVGNDDGTVYSILLSDPNKSLYEFRFGSYLKIVKTIDGESLVECSNCGEIFWANIVSLNKVRLNCSNCN